jgi:hypothetical protein
MIPAEVTNEPSPWCSLWHVLIWNSVLNYKMPPHKQLNIQNRLALLCVGSEVLMTVTMKSMSSGL